MKKLLFSYLFFICFNSFSQSANGYKYFYVNELNYSGSIDYWGIGKQISRYISEKGLLPLNNFSLPMTTCDVLLVSYKHTNVKEGYNYVTIFITDCNGKRTEQTAKGIGLSLRSDYKNATKNVLKKVERFFGDYKFDSQRTSVYKSTVEKYDGEDIDFTDEKSIRDFLSSRNLEPIEGIWNYVGSGNSEYKLLILKDDYFYNAYVLESNGFWNISEIKAIFEPAAVSSVYSLKWMMADKKTQIKTISTLEKGIIKFTFKDLITKTNNESLLYKIFPTLSTKSVKNSMNNGDWLSNGSGIIISKSGYIVTNYHVIEDADDIEVEFILNDEVKKFNAEIVQVDKTNDLAIIKIFDMNFDGLDDLPYNFKSRSSDVGTKVYAFGYPMALSIMGKEIKVTDGIISSKTGFDGNITTYQITAPIQGGNSGGPLFDEQANLIGINSSGIRKDIADNVAYSIKTSYVSNLLDVLPKSIELPSSTRLKSLSLIEQIKEISKYVVLIKVK
jgi:S1-C subfamily serine protease